MRCEVETFERELGKPHDASLAELTKVNFKVHIIILRQPLALDLVDAPYQVGAI